MNNLYNTADLDVIMYRIEQLTPTSQRKWGKMNVAQMLAHCNVSMETALDKNRFRQVLLGRIIAPFFRSSVLGPKPFSKNSPTDKSYIFKDERNFEEERSRLKLTVTRFHEGGPAACTKFPHPFFGSFTPDEWAVFQWKHLDHHLRQFGV